VRALIGLGEALLLAGRLGEAQDRAEEAFDLARERSYRLLEGDALTTVAAVHRAQGSRARARASADAALVCHRDTGYRYGEVRARAILASVTDDPDAAERHRRDVMDLAAAIGVPVPAELPSAGWDRPAR